MDVAPSQSTNATFLPSLQDIRDLTDIERIHLLLKDTLRREQEVNKELEDAFRDSEGVESHLDLVEALP